MDVPVAQPKREWPKYLWGPDGRQARFDSPADVPRDYFPTVDEARAYAERKPVQHLTEPAAASASAAELDEFCAWKEKQAAKMAKARAARKPKAETEG
jgi:hypothetical protein